MYFCIVVSVFKESENFPVVLSWPFMTFLAHVPRHPRPYFKQNLHYLKYRVIKLMPNFEGKRNIAWQNKERN